MDKTDPMVKAWRDRLARNARAFRKIEGRWPGGFLALESGNVIKSVREARRTLEACKRGIEQAVMYRMRPPYVH